MSASKRSTVSIGGHGFPVAMNPECVLESRVSVSTTVANGMWSGSLLHAREAVSPAFGSLPDPYTYQFPGQIGYEPDTGKLSLCYGQGRLQNAVGPIPTVPIAHVVGPLDEFARVCGRVQFQGTVSLELALEPAGPFALPASGRDISTHADVELRLGDSTINVALDYNGVPELAEEFLGHLPAVGFGTNTHSSGPLLRFWNEVGGQQGTTPLATAEVYMSRAQAILYPGYVYYLPKPGYAGLRIATARAALMRSSVGAGVLKLIPLGRFVGAADDFVATAEHLRTTGALPMRIRRLDPSDLQGGAEILEGA